MSLNFLTNYLAYSCVFLFKYAHEKYTQYIYKSETPLRQRHIQSRSFAWRLLAMEGSAKFMKSRQEIEFNDENQAIC